MNNPYKKPESDLGPGIDSDIHLGYELASRMSRLLASLADGIIFLFVAWMLAFFSGIGVMESITTYGGSIEFIAVVFLLSLIIYLAINGYHLKTRGQTLGKALLYIQIVSATDNKILPLWKVILARYLPISIASMLPIIGSLIYLIDCLFIFRRNKRCIHDLIANTRVIYYYA